MEKPISLTNFASYGKSPNDTENLCKEIGIKLSQSGFLLIENLGINKKYLENIFKASKAFFDMDEEEKNQLVF